MRWRRILGLLAGIAVLTTIIVAGAEALGRQARRDLRADITWTNVDGPPDKTTQAYRWYPLTYPVIERWSLGDDGVRQQYALKTVVHFGGPLGRRWLDTAIDRNPAGYGLLPGKDDPTYSAFRDAVGLNDAAQRRRAAESAVRHLGAEPLGGGAFDEQLLAWLAPDSLPAVENWAQNAGPTELQELFEILPYDLSGLTADQAARVARLQSIAKKEVARYERSLPQTPRQRDPNQAIYDAVIALNAGDKRGLPLLRPVVDGDLRRLDEIPSSDLIVLASAFPNSRFAKGCYAYDRLRGGTYFGRDFVYGPDFPTGSVEAWRGWLTAYPDHPGADDATYWLGRTLARDGSRVEAAWAFADGLDRNVGDGDMDHAIWLRLTSMLDVGMTEAELATLVRLHPLSRFGPIIRYARAVRRARANDFRGAIALSEGLDVSPEFRVLSDRHLLYEPAGVARDFDAQRKRWRELAALIPNLRTASIDARDRLASAWSDDDGWKIGYLDLFNGWRQGGAELLGDPDFRWDGLAPLAQGANQNAQTIALAKPLTTRSVPVAVRRRNQRRVIVALYEQQTAFPDIETHAMGSLFSLPSSAGFDVSVLPATRPFARPGDPYYREAARGAAIDDWWARQTIVEAERYVAEYPDDGFSSTALLAAYEVSGHTKYLRQVIDLYPDGPRTEEARALLWRATTRP
jgi:hypothetical protein